MTAYVGQKIAIGFHYVGGSGNGQTGTFRVDNIKLGMGGGTGGNNPCENGNPPLVVGDLNEAFTSGANNASIALTGWVNKATVGTRTWIYKYFAADNNTYAQATAFNDTEANMTAWLVTPLLDIDGPKTLSFETAKSFFVQAGLTVWISTDFNCDPTAATWSPLAGATIAGAPNLDNEWIFSGDIDLSSYIGQKVAIGFKYEGSGPGGQTTTYRVDNVVLQ